ncbi:MAG: baseplate protein [Pseudomonadota bacterium]|nr:baseplate protein [Pseudomonadota bacterium]
MALPVVSNPTYELKLHSVDHKIKYRPFLVKEEKILLTALEGGLTEDIVRATKEIISNCCLDDSIDVQKLPAFDIELFFLNLRARSVGETVEIQMACQKTKDCEGETPVKVNLEKIGLEINKDHTDEIKLTNKIKVKLKYPDIDRMTRPPEESQMDSIFEITKACIESIWEDDEIHDIRDYTEQELEDFIMSLNQQQFGKLIGYFNTMPKLKHKVEFTCPTCGSKQESVLEGLQSFFG